MVLGDNSFYCSNNRCNYHTMQPKENIAQELGDYKLCKDCVSRRFYLDTGTVIKKHQRDKGKSV